MTTLRVHSPWMTRSRNVRAMTLLAMVATNCLFLVVGAHNVLSNLLAAEIPDPLLISILGIGLTSMIGLLAWTVKLLVELTVEVKNLRHTVTDHETRLRANEAYVYRSPAERTRRSDIPRR